MCVLMSVCACGYTRKCCFPIDGNVGTDSLSFLFFLFRPLVFADQLNSTGIPPLPSLHLVPEEEVESEEGDDYY